jgi:hypothetical protein
MISGQVTPTIALSSLIAIVWADVTPAGSGIVTMPVLSVHTNGWLDSGSRSYQYPHTSPRELMPRAHVSG